MIAFVRLLVPLLDRRTRTRLFAASGAMVLLAALEGAGVACIGPLVLLVNQASSTSASASAPPDWMRDLFGVDTVLGAAIALSLVAFAAFISKGIAAVVLLRWNLGVILRAEAEMSRRLLRTYLKAPHRFRLLRPTSDLQRNVHEAVRQVFEGAMTGLVAAGADVLVITAVGLLLFLLEPDVAIVGCVYFGLIAVGYQRLIQGRAQRAGSDVLAGWDTSFKIVQQSLRSAKVLALTQRQDAFADELYGVKMAMADRLRTVMLLFQLPRYYLEISLIFGVGIISTLLFATRPAGPAFAGLALFLAAGFRLLPSINRLLIAASSARTSQAALEEIVADLKCLERDDSPGGPPLLPSTIELRDVAFTHEGAPSPSLSGVSLVVQPGEFVGFAGRSGAGKTTLIDIVLGLLDPTTGAVSIGGRELPSVRKEWQRSVGYVPQEVVIIEATLAVNIALGHPVDEVDRALLDRAVALAQLEEFVEALPDGLDTIVGEDGSTMSGGQRQRIAIARAFYDGATTIVLDEATSALDVTTEQLVMDAVARLRGEITVLVVAHRMSTLQAMDRIYVLEAGRLVETGTYTELRRASGRFADLARERGSED